MANDSLIGPKRNGARWFAVAGVGSIAALIALAVASQRTTLISAEKVLLSSSPVWVALGVGGSAAFLALLVATQFSAQNMVGLDPSYRMLVRPSLEAHMLNQVTKSNALAGLVAFNRDARERGQARGSVVAGYLLAGVAEQFGFALVASVAFVVIISTGSLTTADIIAGLTFVVYLVLTVVVFAAALRSRESIRAVHGWLHRLRVLGRSGPIDHTRADEFYESVDILRRRPFAALYVMVPAIGADLCLVGLLAVALEAVGAPVSVGLVLVTYAVSTLFGIVGFLPSGIGFVEVSAAAALVSGGVDPAQAAAAVGLYRLADSWLPLLAGIAASGERLPRRWWASLRAGAAALALLGGGVGFIVAVGGGGIRRMPVRHLAVGVFRTERFLVALCAVALCTLVPALWRGKSWAAAVAVLLTVLLLRGAHQYRPELALIAAAICAVIGFGHRAFRVRSDPLRARALVGRFLLAQFVVLAYGIAGLFQLDQDFRHSPVLLNSIVEAVRLLFLLPPGTIEPATVHGALFIESVRLLSLTTTTVFLFLLLVPVLKGAPASRGRAVEIVQHWGTTSLAHFLLWDDKSWVTAPDGLVAYRVTGKVALALGGPIGSAEGRAASLLRFVDLCDANGWTPGFHQVTEADRQLLEAEDFQLLHIGANAIVEVKTFSIEGSHWKSLRSTARRLERGGHHVEELLQPLSDETLSELRAISDAWLSSDGHSERSFTLGQFGDDYLRSTKVLAVRNSDGDIQAFVNLLPPYLSGTGSFDLMRRHPESANGVMDLLMLEMIDMYREAGLEGLDLGLAPLAQLPAEDLVDRGLAQIKTHGDQFFHFVGLEQYKAKWLPRWEPSYLAYRTKFDLPAVLLATKTAGEIKTKSPLVDRLSRVTKMYPASLVLCGLITWLMVATALDPSLHVQTFGLLALSWNDIRELEWWRLVTSPLVQTEAGIVPGNLIMTLTLVPLAERLFRSRKSMLAFWVGDFGAVVPVLLVLRLSAAFGSATAFEIVNRPDAGSSAGLWSLAGLIMTRLPERRVRLAVVTIGAGVHLVLWVTQHRLFDLQHLIALIVGYGLGIWWAGRDEPESSADR